MSENGVPFGVHCYCSAPPPLIAPVSRVSRNYHSVLPSHPAHRPKSAPVQNPLRTISPASLSITERVAFRSSVDEPSSTTELHGHSPPTSTAPTTRFSPPLPTAFSDPADAYAFIDHWLSADRPGPFLELHCPPHVFASTATKLPLDNKLPRLARDYNPITQIWHIRTNPHILHEVAGSIQLGLRDLVTPLLTRGKLAGLAQRLIWGAASPTMQLPRESWGTKEPDSCVMLRGRLLPTIVIEVGYSESLPRLRLDAHRWLAKGGVSEEEERKRKRAGPENGGAMRDHGIAYSAVDELNDNEADGSAVDAESTEHEASSDQKLLKPLSIWVEMWRLQPAPLAPTTRANPNTCDTVTMQPHMDERKQFYPSTADDSVTILLQDVFGAEKVRNHGNAVKWNLQLSVLRKAYEERFEVFMAQIAAGLGALEEEEEVLDAGPEDVVADETEAEVVADGGENDVSGFESGEKKRVRIET